MYTLCLPIVSALCVKIGPSDWSEGTGTCNVGSVVKMIPDAGEASGIWLISPPRSACKKLPKLPETALVEPLEKVYVGGVTAVGIKQLNLLVAPPLVQLICAKAEGDTAMTSSNTKNMCRSIIWFTLSRLQTLRLLLRVIGIIPSADVYFRRELSLDHCTV